MYLFKKARKCQLIVSANKGKIKTINRQETQTSNLVDNSKWIHAAI